MSRLIVIVLAFLALQATAQRECATAAYTQRLRSVNAALAARMDAASAFARQQTRNYITGASGLASSATTVIRIPVVVHVLYNTAAQNISDAQIQSALDALNRDFRRTNPDTINTPERFKSVAADVAIEFHLATADPNGRATTGIIRKQTSVPAFNQDDKIKYAAQGGDNAWDSRSYLNIWIGNTRRLLGYGSLPGSDAAVDGLVINYTTFGTINTAAPYNLGRTAVHEVGHWLGLIHIWGDEACGSDDVDDTPVQGGYTTGCPTGFRSSCNNGTGGDMYMNYMDFTNDACMNLFTKGQKDRMRAQFAPGGARYSLLSSKGLNAPWVEAAPLSEADTLVQTAVTVYPNPSTTSVTLRCNTAANAAGTLYLLNARGMAVLKINITTATQKINLNGLPAGVYILHGQLKNIPVYQKILKLN